MQMVDSSSGWLALISYVFDLHTLGNPYLQNNNIHPPQTVMLSQAKKQG